MSRETNPLTDSEAHRSHTTAWIVAIAIAVPVLYFFGYPWAYLCWQRFVGPPPHWLTAFGAPFDWIFYNTRLGNYLNPYWFWCRSFLALPPP